MLRAFSTYLLLIITCSFSIMSLSRIYLCNFKKTTRLEAYYIAPSKQVIFTNHKTENVPLREFFMLENFESENETEVESDIKTDIFFIGRFPENSSNDFQRFFSNAYTSYSFISIKIEFCGIQII